MDWEGILAIGGFFTTVLGITLGLPLVKHYIRSREANPALSAGERDREQRLARMEHAIESIAVEVERISEGQRFVTKLLAESQSGALPAPRDEGRR